MLHYLVKYPRKLKCCYITLLNIHWKCSWKINKFKINGKTICQNIWTNTVCDIIAIKSFASYTLSQRSLAVNSFLICFASFVFPASSYNLLFLDGNAKHFAECGAMEIKSFEISTYWYHFCWFQLKCDLTLGESNQDVSCLTCFI